MRAATAHLGLAALLFLQKIFTPCGGAGAADADQGHPLPEERREEDADYRSDWDEQRQGLGGRSRRGSGVHDHRTPDSR
jgi:hypothetical protein